MKILWIASAIGVGVGAVVTFLYFCLATLFSANAKAARAHKPKTLPEDFEAQAVSGENKGSKARGVSV